MAPAHVPSWSAKDERYRSDEDDSVLLSRMRMVIYGIGIAAALVAIRSANWSNLRYSSGRVTRLACGERGRKRGASRYKR